MKKGLLAISYLLFVFSMMAQAPIGGQHVYEFLNLPQSARVTALGGSLITVKDDDVALAFSNPAVLNPSMDLQLSFNHNIHLAGINNGYASFGKYLESMDVTMHGGIQYVSYGTFDEADEYGNITGTFKASEYAFTVGGARQLYDKLSVGANLKAISSQFETYNSFGLSADFGAFYQDTSGLFSATLVIKNVGGQITSYDGTRESIPFDVQLGISRKLDHLPFRFSIIYHNLQSWNILYDDPNSEETVLFLGDIQNDGENKFKTFTDNLFRHFIFSGEFLLGKKENFRMRFGYNHMQRKELSVNNYRSLSGFSLGLGLKVNRFRIEYGRAFYHLAGGLNHFSISTNIHAFRR